MSESSQTGTATGRDFRTTHWSIVVLAAKDYSGGSAKAIETLCRTYYVHDQAPAANANNRLYFCAGGACFFINASARRAISSGGTSSTCVAMCHWWPNGSMIEPARSP